MRFLLLEDEQNQNKVLTSNQDKKTVDKVRNVMRTNQKQAYDYLQQELINLNGGRKPKETKNILTYLGGSDLDYNSKNFPIVKFIIDNYEKRRGDFIEDSKLLKLIYNLQIDNKIHSNDLKWIQDYDKLLNESDSDNAYKVKVIAFINSEDNKIDYKSDIEDIEKNLTRDGQIKLDGSDKWKSKQEFNEVMNNHLEYSNILNIFDDSNLYEINQLYIDRNPEKTLKNKSNKLLSDFIKSTESNGLLNLLKSGVVQFNNDNLSNEDIIQAIQKNVNDKFITNSIVDDWLDDDFRLPDDYKDKKNGKYMYIISQILNLISRVKGEEKKSKQSIENNSITNFNMINKLYHDKTEKNIDNTKGLINFIKGVRKNGLLYGIKPDLPINKKILKLIKNYVTEDFIKSPQVQLWLNNSFELREDNFENTPTLQIINDILKLIKNYSPITSDNIESQNIKTNSTHKQRGTQNQINNKKDLTKSRRNLTRIKK